MKLEHSSAETVHIIQKATAVGTGDWQLHHNTPTHASRLMQSFLHNIKSPGDSAPLKPKFEAVQLLDFPKTKTTFEREEISDCQWDSGEYNGVPDVIWKNCVRSQGAYFEGDWGIIVLCTMFLVSCIFFEKCLYFSYYVAGYFLDRPHIILITVSLKNPDWYRW